MVPNMVINKVHEQWCRFFSKEKVVAWMTFLLTKHESHAEDDWEPLWIILQPIYVGRLTGVTKHNIGVFITQVHWSLVTNSVVIKVNRNARECFMVNDDTST